MTHTVLNKIVEIMTGEDECWLGLRGMYADETLGDMRPSRVWDDGIATNEELSGTCAVNLGEWWDGPEFSAEDVEQALKIAKRYGDGKIGLIVGTSAKSGEDRREVILTDARCIYIF